MRRVSLFAEDFGHEEFLKALLFRLAGEYGVEVVVEVRSASGGHGRVLRELREYVRDLRAGARGLPDLLLVATDANCRGYSERKKEIDGVVGDLKDWVVCAVPDPHIERWLLIDSAAFKAALGRGCSAPDMKCDRDRYKQRLREAVREAGISPLVGGMEHAAAIVEALDLDRVREGDPALAKLLDGLRSWFKEWRR